MRMFIPLSSIATIAMIGFATTSSAVPTPSDKPVKWEYAELVAQNGADLRVPKGGDPLNGLQPIQPPPIRVRWITAHEEITAANWEELAEKLKAPAAGKEATTRSHKLRVFDRLGADGWELVGQQTGTTPAWAGTSMFKRRVP